MKNLNIYIALCLAFALCSCAVGCGSGATGGGGGGGGGGGTTISGTVTNGGNSGRQSQIFASTTPYPGHGTPSGYAGFSTPFTGVTNLYTINGLTSGQHYYVYAINDKSTSGGTLGDSGDMWGQYLSNISPVSVEAGSTGKDFTINTLM